MGSCTDPSCIRTMDPDRALGAAQATQINITPIGSMAVGYQHGLRWLTIPQVSTQP